MQKRRPGDVIEVPLPRGRFAYGRVYRDASIGFNRARTTDPARPPIGSRDFAFFVGVEEQALSRLRLVGSDPFDATEDEWPPPASIRDGITGRYSIYEHGTIRPGNVQDAAHLEPAAVWGLSDLQARLDRGE